MKRISGIILILIVLAAFTPLGCFADDLTCNDFQPSDNCRLDESSNITLNGDTTLDLKGMALTANAVECVYGASPCSLTITGTGTLTVTGSIKVNDDLNISGGQVTVAGSTTFGIYAQNGINIKGGTVTVTDSTSCGIHAQNGTITISGMVTVTGSPTYSINAPNGTITISGGQVTVSGSTTFGIHAKNGITIRGGTVTATGGTYGIYAERGSDITIRGGTVENATGSVYGIFASQNITIEKGGTVKEVSGGTYGIYTPNGTITISGTVTASGNDQAVKGSVKNTVPGIGWTDMGGTEGRELIRLPSNPESGQDLSSYSYKKVQFPAPSATITFQVVNGAWDDENTEDQKVTLYSADGTTWTLPQDQIPAVGNKPSEGYQTGSWDPEEPTADMVITEDRTFTYTYTTDAMELPVEISVVQGSGEKGVPDDVKAQTIRLTIRLKQNGEVKLSSAPIELAVTPGGNREPAEFDAVTFMPDTPDFKESCGNYEYEVAVTPKEVKADIAGAGDDGPAWLLRAAAGSPDCEKFVVTLYWNNKAASEPEVIRVVALPEDEIGAYQLRADGTKEYLLFQTYDICMTYLGRDELCRGPERCYHK